MKAAIAAFAVACVHQREAILAGRGAVLLITGGEETGCDGARALIASATLPEVGALIVGEPTANYPVIGHKGALWLRCETRGKPPRRDAGAGDQCYLSCGGCVG